MLKPYNAKEMFGKRLLKKKKLVVSNNFSDQAASKIVAGIERMQRRVAHCLNKRTRHFSKTTWLLLTLLCLVGWIHIGSSIIRDAFDERVTHPVIRVKTIRQREGRRGNDSLLLLERIYDLRPSTASPLK